MITPSHLVNADRLNQALAQITKTPALTAGILQVAAEVITKEGCLAMDSTRVSIWQTNFEKEQLDCITSYSAEDRCHYVQEPFPFDDKPLYINLLQTERFILINDADKDILIPSLREAYGPSCCSLLDAPIRVGGKLVGVVCIEQFYAPRYWTSAEQTFASSLADFMALAMASAERRQAMKELAQSKRLTETLMSNLPGMVYQCLNDPPNFTLTYVSEGCLPLTGYTPEELIQNSALKFSDMVYPDDLEFLAEAKKSTLAVGLALETSFRLISKDKTIKWVWERSRVAEYDKDGTPLLLEGFYTSISEQRRMEAAALAHKAKNEFLTTISKELRVPMNIIHRTTDLALRQYPSENTFNCLLSIKAAADSLLTIANDLLDFSKIETRVEELVTKPYLVSSLINDTVMLAHARIGDNPVELIVEDCPNIPQRLLGDAFRLHHIFSHMLHAAIKATPCGEILFALEAKPTQDADIILLKGSITGTRSDAAQEGTQEATKAELSIARNLLELMGGTLAENTTDTLNTQIVFELAQVVADARPNVQKAENTRRVGVWLENQRKAISLIGKLESLGFAASVADGPEDFAGYTDVFFDYKNLAHIIHGNVSRLHLIGLSRKYTDNRSLPSNIHMVCSPLTSPLTAQLLTGSIDGPVISAPHTPRGYLWLRSAKILIVDDSDINLTLAEGILENYGAAVHTASSGKQALQLVAENDYHLVFMDYMMPEMDGAEATALIRAMPGERFQSLPIVALTASAAGNVWDTFATHGMNDFLAKPMNTKELEQILCTWLPRDTWTRSV